MLCGELRAAAKPTRVCARADAIISARSRRAPGTPPCRGSPFIFAQVPGSQLLRSLGRGRKPRENDKVPTRAVHTPSAYLSRPGSSSGTCKTFRFTSTNSVLCALRVCVCARARRPRQYLLPPSTVVVNRTSPACLAACVCTTSSASGQARQAVSIAYTGLCVSSGRRGDPFIFGEKSQAHSERVAASPTGGAAALLFLRVYTVQRVQAGFEPGTPRTDSYLVKLDSYGRGPPRPIRRYLVRLDRTAG